MRRSTSGSPLLKPDSLLRLFGRKLAELKKAYEQKVREKEAEIAALDIEIRKQQAAGQDVALLVEQRNRALTELEKLRNELKDIEFAIVIRNDESEFAVHEAEILQLKKELAALRNSTDALIKDLQQQLIDTEKKLLALIEESRPAPQARIRNSGRNWKRSRNRFLN